MKNEDQMIDVLLKEHARKGAGDDAEFLNTLDAKLDKEDRMTSAIKPESNRRGYGLRLGVAATLALGAFGVYHYTKDDGFGDQVAMNDSTVANEQVAKMSVEEMAPADDFANTPGAKGPGERGLKKENERLVKGVETDVRLKSRRADMNKDVSGLPTAKSTLADAAKPSIALETEEAQLSPPAASQPLSRITGMAAPKKSKGNVGASLKPLAESARTANHARQGGKGGAHFGRTDDGELTMRKRGGFKYDQPRPVQGNRYGALTDNTFKSPWKAPFSTFSVDVDTASYTNIRRMIQGGQAVAKDAVRIEEMINYFSYNYPQPEGKHPFSVNVETASCPWNEQHRLVKVGLKGKDIIREERPAANLIFLLDVSGSMNSQDKLPLLVDSMKILLKELNADDSVSIVVYAGAQGLALPPTYVDEAGRKTILNKLNNFRSGGSTNGGAGITLAYKMAKKHFVKGGVNRVILGTDGDFNVGATGDESLVSMVEREAKSGVFLSVLGFGQGNLNDSMLEKITNKGNGNYSYIDSLSEGRKVFLDDMMGNLVTIAKDVKIQIEFNPAKVKSYRLIGYANRMLKAEDFRNKLIDAGEIGAGHTVTALYEIVPGNAAEIAPVVDGLKYQKKKAEPKPVDREVVGSPEMLTVKLAYKQPEATKETESTYFNTAVIDSEKTWLQASEDFKFSSGVALCGMILRQSEHAGQGNYELVKKLAEQGRGKDEKGYRTEFSDLVRRLTK